MLNFFPDIPGAVVCVLGSVAQVLLGRRLRVPAPFNFAAAALVAGLFFVVREDLLAHVHLALQSRGAADFVGGLLICWFLSLIGAWTLLAVQGNIPAFRSDRRHFLRATSMAVCAAPAAVLTAGFVTRKDVHVKECTIHFPNLPKDLQGLKILLLSDIHMGAFFSAQDLERVVDASNQLRPDLAFVTGDLITSSSDPLDRCLLELRRLRSNTGVWGCMGNHELYAMAQNYTKVKGMEMGIDFLREESRRLRFGTSELNLVGVDYQRPAMPYLPDIEQLVVPGTFNLLLSHNPDVFPVAAMKGFDLTLSGHTHGGQINLEIMGTNLNAIDFVTPYTKGLYRTTTSSIYVTAGLGTIAIPVRIGAPPEITLIRLGCA